MFKPIILCCCLFYSGLCLAQIDADFYASSVDVVDRQAKNVQQALRDALVEVLSKVSGIAPELIQQRASLAQDLAQGDKLVSQFIFVNQKTDTVDDNSHTQLKIKASFPETQVMRLLQKGGLAFWSPERKPVELWILQQQQGQIVWAYEQQEQQKALQFWQQQAVLTWGFGLITQPFIPLNPQQLWLSDNAMQYKLAQQQTANELVLARISLLQADITQGTITLLGQNETVEITAETFSQWVKNAVDWTEQQLAKRYAVQLLSNNNEVAVTIKGINNDVDYQEIMRFLENIDIVQKVYLLSLNSNELKLAISFTTENQQLKKRLLESPRLLSDTQKTDTFYQFYMQWN